MMDLILWRHAEAEDGDDDEDLQRALTGRGAKQAKRVAGWLDRHLPEGTRVVTSPAIRCEHTAMALARKYKVDEKLAPNASAASVLEAAQWPHARQAMLLVGHQPGLGETVAQLLGLQGGSCAIRKGAVWWLRTRERDGQQQTVVWAVQAPETV